MIGGPEHAERLLEPLEPLCAVEEVAVRDQVCGSVARFSLSKLVFFSTYYLASGISGRQVYKNCCECHGKDKDRTSVLQIVKTTRRKRLVRTHLTPTLTLDKWYCIMGKLCSSGVISAINPSALLSSGSRAEFPRVDWPLSRTVASEQGHRPIYGTFSGRYNSTLLHEKLQHSIVICSFAAAV